MKTPPKNAIIYLTKVCEMSQKGSGQADATIENWNGRGVYVPKGQTADEIMRGAIALVNEFDVPPYTARLMTSAVLSALRATSVTPDMHDQGGLRAAFERMDRIHSAFERCKRLGLPYPALHDLDRIADGSYEIR